MKTILILVGISFLAGCKELPPAPAIKYHYAIEVKQQNFNLLEDTIFVETVTNPNEIEAMASSLTARCLKFEIVTFYPYKIKYLHQAPLQECDLVGGYKPKDMQLLLNWIDDVVRTYK